MPQLKHLPSRCTFGLFPSVCPPGVVWGCLTLSLPLAWCLPRRGDQAIRYYSSPDVWQRFPFLDEAYPIDFNKSQLLPEGWRWSGLLALICSYVTKNLWWAQSCLRSPSFKVFLQSFDEICAPSIYGMGNDWKALRVSICLQGTKHRSSVGISRPCTDHLLGGLLLSGSVVVCECLLQGTLHPSWALLCGRDTSLCWIPMNTTTESARHVFPAICHSRCRDCNTSSLGGHPTPLWGL